LKSSNKIKNNK